ncbi:Transmembrane protein C9orf91-like protein [Aphelenchoides bicaudatus]|nr:Transmembrane protein C9orf91-like protein [Aphelenchoides bicaudatus]
MSDPLNTTADQPKTAPSSSKNEELPSSTLSEIFLDDADWTKAQFASQTPKEPNNVQPKTPETTKTTESNGQLVQTTSLTNGIEVIDDKKALKTGKVISLVYPSNKRCSWLAPPYYSFEKMPKAFSSKELQVPHAAYTQFMRTVTQDIRFQSYVVLFSRIVPLWVMFSVVLLMFMLLASQDGGLHVMVFTVLWTIMLCVGIGFCVLIRKYLVHALHLVVRDANELSLKHNILIGVQDRGQLSCHKTVIVLMFYDPADCIADIKKLIRVHKANQPVKIEMPSEEEVGIKC